MVRLTTDPVLSLDGVTVRYGDTVAVDDLTLTIGAGERVALIGPSGAGKTTLLRLTAGLTNPTSGSIRVLGVTTSELARRSMRDVRSRIGFVTQDYSLVGPLRVASNVAAGRLGQMSALHAAKVVFRPGPVAEISDVLAELGIDDKIWDRTDRLSGGQQQRTAIARTLFQSPDLLLADEPVGALDPAWSDSVMTSLTKTVEQGSGRAVIVSVHDAQLAVEHFDRVIALRNGRVEFDLEASQVTQGLLTALYELDDPT